MSDRKQPPSDPELEGATAALKRAALRAREEARRTGTRLVIIREGQLVWVKPGVNPETDEIEPVKRVSAESVQEERPD